MTKISGCFVGPLEAEVVGDLVATIMLLEKEISRVLCSQVTMLMANRAVRTGRSEILRSMEFSEVHIVELTGRAKTGGDAFPDYVLRNNRDLIRSLRKRQAELIRQLPPNAVADVFGSSRDTRKESSVRLLPGSNRPQHALQ